MPDSTRTEDLIRVDMIFGRVELRTWIEYDPVRERFIGMGETKHFDKDGFLTKIDVSPTGMEAWYEEPKRASWWKRIFHAR